MNMASSNGYSAVVAAPASVGRGLVRWAVLGAAGVIALILALSHSGSVGAQAPNCVPINYTTCVANGTAYLNNNATTGVTYANVNSGFPGNAAVSAPYFDNRYGFVQVVTDSSGNLIDINPATGQRIFPIFGDFVGGAFGNGFIGANFNNGFVGNGVVCNGVFGCPGAFNNFNGFNGVNGFNGFNGGAFPAGATNVGGGVFTYNDNRFCGDGKLFFVAGRGSSCQNGNALFANGNFAGNGNGFFGNGFVYPNFRGFEVTQPTTAVVAAPVTAAPVAAPTTQVAAPAAVQQAPAVAAPAQMPTALTAPQVQTPDASPTGGGGVHVLSAPAATAPAATTDTDDHRG